MNAGEHKLHEHCAKADKMIPQSVNSSLSGSARQKACN